jgi:arsenite-transporting ATPase
VSRGPTRRRSPCYEFVGGKGGVGKTTLAAALALAAGEVDRSALVVSTDPAHSLGDALGRRLGPQITRLPTMPGRRAVHALELDAHRALARWLRPRRSSLRLIAERGTYLDRGDIDPFLDLSFPGVDELGGLLELVRLAETGRYDTVVVDTAPTGHTLRMLAVPEALRRIAAALGQMLAKHHFLLTRLSGEDRDDGADALVAELETEARRLSDLLRDPRRRRFRWVVLPEMLAVAETRDAIAALEARGITVDEIIVNRVTPRPASDGPLRQKMAAEQAALAALRRAFPDRRIRLVPELACEPRGPAALQPLTRRLARDSSDAVVPRGRPARPVAPHRRTRPARGAVQWPALLAPPGLRLLLVMGKGGVGKTTCAAAAAVALGDAAPGQRVLLLSTDPAHSLGDVLLTALDDAERPVPPGPRALRARELDADRAFTVLRERYRRAVDALFDAIRGDSRFDVAFDRAVARDLLDLAPGGVDELCALLTVTETLFPPAGEAPRYDLVVVDTAPTGHTLRLLALPELALEWVKALMATLLKYRQVLGLGALAADLVALSRGFRGLGELLRDGRRARVVVVTRAAMLPRLETLRALRRLRALGLRTSAVVVNAVGAPAGTRRPQLGRAETEEIRVLRAAVGTRDGATPVLLAPAAFPPPRGVPALRAWARTWTEAAS